VEFNGPFKTAKEHEIHTFVPNDDRRRLHGLDSHNRLRGDWFLT
jgi:hypothetical protein